MEPIHVVIADKSQLVRMGVTGILYQIGYVLNIREISDPEKLKPAILKEHNNLMIISRSFIEYCSAETLHLIQFKRKQLRLILINDNSGVMTQSLNFDEIIEYQDVERTLYRKFEKCMQALSKPTRISPNGDEISLREKEVLKLVALGLTNREIAEKLFISTHTVITHRKNITSKLGIKTIAGLTVYAVINKLISAEEIK